MPGAQKSAEELDRHAKVLFEWLGTDQRSRIRMLAQWQAAGGLSFNACVYHRSAQCFKYHGNSKHDGGETGVSLTEFQRAVRVRHQLGSAGIGGGDGGDGQGAVKTSDFE